ncbi:hypothetical protein NP233_g8060 [Leucocoprinus birnbaumii]|uniref:Uncharacterized protein n=1 Tax=Leucocoprinus birnbaumii TaxID=56174 RepID=A0AAD5VMY9_9AGAR|nr:hypothetical protein NP233_g8060 [Leucocoprinus birnbaumii]
MEKSSAALHTPQEPSVLPVEGLARRSSDVEVLGSECSLRELGFTYIHENWEDDDAGRAATQEVLNGYLSFTARQIHPTNSTLEADSGREDPMTEANSDPGNDWERGGILSSSAEPGEIRPSSVEPGEIRSSSVEPGEIRSSSVDLPYGKNEKQRARKRLAGAEEAKDEEVKKPNKRRRGPQERRTRNRGGGKDIEGRADALQQKLLPRTEQLGAEFFSLIRDVNRTSSGWAGSNPPWAIRSKVQGSWKNKKNTFIEDEIRHFKPVRYDISDPKPAAIMDAQGYQFVYRSIQQPWIEEEANGLWDSIQNLLGHELSNEKTIKQHQSHQRGNHLPCIIGHHRQYTSEIQITKWHHDNSTRVDRFMESKVIQRISNQVSAMTWLAFPGAATRFKRAAQLLKEKNGPQPLFGLFWNLCINAAFNGQRRVHCKPHADKKNVVGVCALLVYTIPGTSFDHKHRSWLVLWEAKVVIELPPWVVLLYPSSLLYHFNIDVHGGSSTTTRLLPADSMPDFSFVTTDGEEPDLSRSDVLEQGDFGRGSMVWFNQASIFQAAETGFSTLKEARDNGHSGTTDFEMDIKAEFTKHCFRIPLDAPTGN